MRKLNIALVDDNSDYREAIKMMLSKYDFVTIQSEASNGKEFLEVLDKHVPDIVFMDIHMPVMNGIEATKQAIKNYGKLVIIALSFLSDFKYTYEMIHAGARNYLVKNNLNVKDLDAIIKDTFAMQVTGWDSV